MRVAFFLATFFAASVSAFASAASVVSPNHPQTFAYGEMIWNQLYLERAGGELAARVTFSNLPYAGDDEPRRDESFDFRLDRKSTRLNSSHRLTSRMPSSA